MSTSSSSGASGSTRCGHPVVGHIGDDPVVALRAIREALVLPYSSLRLDGKIVAESGVEVSHTRTIPLALGADRSGELAVGLRAGDMTLSAGDHRVLSLVAPLLAQTLRARALADELRESRGEPSPQSRRNAVGCAATSTTASDPGCPGSPSPLTPFATPCARTLPQLRTCCGHSVRRR